MRRADYNAATTPHQFSHSTHLLSAIRPAGRSCIRLFGYYGITPITIIQDFRAIATLSHSGSAAHRVPLRSRPFGSLPGPITGRQASPGSPHSGRDLQPAQQFAIIRLAAGQHRAIRRYAGTGSGRRAGLLARFNRYRHCRPLAGSRQFYRPGPLQFHPQYRPLIY